MEKKEVCIGSDHAGLELKEELKEFLDKEDYEIKDLGSFKINQEDDYPDYALKLSKEVSETNGKGILVCGSGHGMNIVANKIPGIRATVCWNEKSAEYAKSHTNINIICIPSRVISKEEAEKITNTWLNTKFEGAERHIRRINKINEIEEDYLK